MNDLNHEVFDQIKEWIERGEWKEEEYVGYSEEVGAHMASYTSPWFRDLTDEERESMPDDEDDYFTFHLRIYILEDGTYKIEFDPGLFHLMYKGYDTEEDRQAWSDFRNLAREKDVLYEP